MLFGALRLRRFSYAPLALLIGTPAKRVKEIGAPSLKHPFARVFTALVAPSPLANSKGCNAVPFHRVSARSTTSAIQVAAAHFNPVFERP
jgi:homogentisate 1,2-dioxygenase